MRQRKRKTVTASRRRDDDFSLPAGNSRRRRRLKNPGAPAPGFTGVWGRSATNKRASVYTEALLAATKYPLPDIEREESPTMYRRFQCPLSTRSQRGPSKIFLFARLTTVYLSAILPLRKVGKYLPNKIAAQLGCIQRLPADERIQQHKEEGIL